MKKKILILGGALLQSFVIKRARELDYEVHVLDMNPDSMGFKMADKYAVINIVDQDACLEYAKENKIDGVLTAATDYGVLTTSYIAEKLELNGIKYDVAKTIKNKYLVRKKLFENKADDVEQFFEIDDINELSDISSKVKFPVMVKPCDGSGSRATTRVDKLEDLEEAVRLAIDSSLSSRALIETFITGHEYGVESFVYDKKTYVMVIMQKDMTSPPYYAELGHTVPSGLSDEMEDKIKKSVCKAIKALDINFGSVNMDLLVTDEGKVCIVDIGARMGGNLIGSHIIPISTGIDYMGNMIKAALGEKVDFKKIKKECVSTRLLALSPGIVKKIPDFNKYYDDTVKDIVCHLNANDEIREYHNNLDGCGYVVVSDKTSALSKEKAEIIKNKIDKDIERK